MWTYFGVLFGIHTLIARHPGASTFTRSGKKVCVKETQEITVGIKDFIGIYILVVNRYIRMVFEMKSKQPACHSKGTLQNIFKLEIWLQGLIVQGKALHLQLF